MPRKKRRTRTSSCVGPGGGGSIKLEQNYLTIAAAMADRMCHCSISPANSLRASLPGLQFLESVRVPIETCGTGWTNLAYLLAQIPVLEKFNMWQIGQTVVDGTL